MLELFKPLQVLTSYDDLHRTEGDCLWKDLGQLAPADSEDTAGPYGRGEQISIISYQENFAY